MNQRNEKRKGGRKKAVCHIEKLKYSNGTSSDSQKDGAESSYLSLGNLYQLTSV